MDNPEVEELYIEACGHHDEDRYEDAEKCYKAALNLDPCNFNILFSLGVLYYEMEKFKKAVKYSKKALELEQGNARICFNIGLAYDMQDMYAKSIEYFSRAVENDPEYATAFFARGNTRMEMKLFALAAEDFKTAVTLDLPYLTVWTNLARCLRKTGHFRESLDAYLIYENLITVTSSDQQFFTVRAEPDEIALGKSICFYMLGEDGDAVKSLLQVTKPEQLRLTALVFLTAIDAMNGRTDDISHSIAQLEQGTPGVTSHRTELLKCPYSRFLFRIERLPPQNEKYRGPMWSDGMVPGLASQAVPFIEFCPACGMFHLIKDLIRLHDIPNRMYGDDIPQITWDDVQPDEFYHHALEQDWPGDIEKQLRIRLLWEQNDNHREQPPVEISNYHEHFDNLECLLELISHDGKSLCLAEFNRELGDFKRCIRIINSLPPDPAKQYIIDGIREAAEKRIIAPVWLEKSSTSTLHMRKEIPFEKRRDFGFDPHPVAEDIFAFPYHWKDDEYKPVLAVDLSKINPEWQGWAGFLYKSDEFYFRHGRIFSNNEWADFQKLSPGWRDNLLWFWSFKSWKLPKDQDELDEYYRILYQLYYKCDYADFLYTNYDSFLNIDLEAFKDDFSVIWKGIEFDLNAMGGKYKRWVGEHKSRIYWDFFWQFYNDNFGVPDREKLEELFTLEHNYIRKLDAGRRSAMSGLKYVEIGGSPSWFQGQNKTPGDSEFVGQLWSDYMNIGSKLLYLFYDTTEEKLIEKYDWD